MKIQKLIIILVALNAYTLFSQTVDIPFIFFDGIYTDTNLRVGLDPTATGGIDTHLGEFAVPTHLPPTGNMWLWFYLDSLDLASYRDYRYAPSFPYSGACIHRISGNLSSVATEFTMIYNFPQGVTANVKDPFGGTIFNQDLLDSGSYSFPIGVYFPFIILTMYYDNVIPVELISFTAKVNNDKVELDWTTATETNNSGFEIQKLQDYRIEKLKDWEAIGFVPGYGTSTEPKSYSFFDENVTSGTYKYRLKQIDFDGSFTYSNEIEVEIDFTPKEFVLYQNYPNPFNPNTKIKYTIPKVETHLPAGRQGRDASLQMVTLKVYDVLGKEVATLVNEEKQPGVYEVEFYSHSDEGQNLSSGIYFYQLKVGSFVQTKKMIFTK